MSLHGITQASNLSTQSVPFMLHRLQNTHVYDTQQYKKAMFSKLQTYFPVFPGIKI